MGAGTRNIKITEVNGDVVKGEALDNKMNGTGKIYKLRSRIFKRHAKLIKK